MEKTVKITQDNVKDVINALEWKPRGQEITITTNVVEAEDDGLDLTSGMISSEQIVVAVGEHVRDIKAGDTVFLDITKLVKISPNSRDFDTPVQELNIFPLLAGDYRLGIIHNTAVKLIKK